MDFSIRILRLCGKLPECAEAQAIRKQLIRSGTSPGAHYREASRGRSTAEFASKLNGGLQEPDETAYWLELIVHAKLHDTPEIRDLIRETDELTRIFVACIRKSKASNE